MNLYGIWKEFFNNLNKISLTIEPYSKRSGLTIRQAMILILLNDYNDFDLSLYNDDIVELVKSGYVVEKENKLILTGKGAILTKSFISKL